MNTKLIPLMEQMAAHKEELKAWSIATRAHFDEQYEYEYWSEKDANTAIELLDLTMKGKVEEAMKKYKKASKMIQETFAKELENADGYLKMKLSRGKGKKKK